MDKQQEYDGILALEDEWTPPISVSEAQQLKPIQKRFVESYLAKEDNVPVGTWLRTELGRNLPERNAEEIAEISDGIISVLKLQEEKSASLEAAVRNGRSKESWFAGEAKKATSFLSAQEAGQFLQSLDNQLASANESLRRTIQTQAGVVSQNPSLDGFIAEQYHAQTFNMNAEAAGSPYRAKVLEPDGTGYRKNSVDIEIVDGNGKVVRRYQCKYGKDAQSTEGLFEKGDYRGQQRLVPKDQVSEMSKKSTAVLEAPDGTKSNPLSKPDAKKMQAEAQSGKWNDLNWNEYQVKDLATGIGKQAGQAALMGAAIGVGFDVAQKVWNGEEVKGEELVETALVSGADFGLKAAAAGAIKVGAEKGILTAIPKGTPIGTITNVVHVGVENLKIVGKMATGELTAKEGIEKMEQVTVSTVAGIAASAEGMLAGSAIGLTFGPVGMAIGGFVGGTLSYMAGSKIAETVVKGAQRLRENIVDAVCSAGERIVDTVSSLRDRVVGGLQSLLSW